MDHRTADQTGAACHNEHRFANSPVYDEEHTLSVPVFNVHPICQFFQSAAEIPGKAPKNPGSGAGGACADRAGGLYYRKSHDFDVEEEEKEA